ncbi:hypothetical protein AgCh_035750 [Apium graveolens]
MAGRQLIDPGPIDGGLLTQQNRHRSQLVWGGTGSDDHLRLRSNFKTYWDCVQANPLPQPQPIQDAITEAGFMGVLLAGIMRHDVGLISAFLDRWRPETHTFHLRFGEATVTLEDVYYILGLRSVGHLVLPIPRDVGALLVHELLGVAPDPQQDTNVIKKGEIKISWLVRQFGDCYRLHSATGHDHEHELLYHTHAHLLLLIGSTVPNYSGFRMHLNLLPFVRHVGQISTYSWGCACLAYLYRRLCSASIGYKAELYGSMTLLQVDGPIGWYDCADTFVRGIRYDLDTMSEDSFRWRPYGDSAVEARDIPELELSLMSAPCPLIYLTWVEWCYTDRVTRQFGYLQQVPTDFPLTDHDSFHRGQRGWPFKFTRVEGLSATYHQIQESGVAEDDDNVDEALQALRDGWEPWPRPSGGEGSSFYTSSGSGWEHSFQGHGHTDRTWDHFIQGEGDPHTSTWGHSSQVHDVGGSSWGQNTQSYDAGTFTFGHPSQGHSPYVGASTMGHTTQGSYVVPSAWATGSSWGYSTQTHYGHLPQAFSQPTYSFPPETGGSGFSFQTPLWGFDPWLVRDSSAQSHEQGREMHTPLIMQDIDVEGDSEEQDDDDDEEADPPIQLRQQPRRAVKGKGRLCHTDGSTTISSSINNKWLLSERDDDYRSLRVSDPVEYFAGVRRKWAFRREESESLTHDLIAMSVRVPLRRSLSIYPRPHKNLPRSEFRRKVVKAVTLIRRKNNRMLLRRSRYYIFRLAQDSVRASGRELTEAEQHRLLQNEDYISDDYMSNEQT